MHHVTTKERWGCFPPEGCDCHGFRPVNDGRIDIDHGASCMIVCWCEIVNGKRLLANGCPKHDPKTASAASGPQ